MHHHSHLLSPVEGVAPSSRPGIILAATTRCQLALKLAATANRPRPWPSLATCSATASDAQRRLPFGRAATRPADEARKPQRSEPERSERGAKRRRERVERSEANAFGRAEARHLNLFLHKRLYADGPSSQRLLLAFAVSASSLQPAQLFVASPPPPPPSPNLASLAITAATHSLPIHPANLPGHVHSPEQCSAAHQIWSDLDLQIQHSACCHAPIEQDLLLIASEKTTVRIGSSFGNFWTRQKLLHNYDALASIISCSTYSKREDLVRCGFCAFHCQDVSFCPRCSYRRLARPAVEEFGDTHASDQQVFYIVLSLSSQPNEAQRFIFRDVGEVDLHQAKARSLAPPCTGDNYGIEFNTSADLIQCRLLWQIFADVMRHFTGNGRGKIFSGVVAGPELAVRFQPLRVLPHSNFICWSPGFSADDARRLRREIRDRIRNCRRLTLPLYPSLACYRLASPDDLRAVLRYSFKPIDLAGAYLTAGDRVDYEPVGMANLNRDTNTFLSNMPRVFHRLPRITRLGRCCASHREYFGHVTPYRQLQRQRGAERRQRLGGGIEVRVDASTPQPRRLSGFDRWEALLQQQVRYPLRRRHSRFSRWHDAFLRRTSPPPSPGMISISY